MTLSSKRLSATLLGAAYGWCLSWLSIDCLGLFSPIYHPDGLRFYLIGFGALYGYSIARWGWHRTSQLFDDWSDTFGTHPAEPMGQVGWPSAGRVTTDRKPDTAEEPH